MSDKIPVDAETTSPLLKLVGHHLPSGGVEHILIAGVDSAEANNR